VACRANRIAKINQRVSVAVWEYSCDLDIMSRCLALAPPVLPGSAVEGSKPAKVPLW